MPVVEREMVELVDDFLARFAGEERGVLDHRRVDLFEAEAGGGLAEEAEEPVPPAHVFGVEVAGAAGGLEVEGLGRCRRVLLLDGRAALAQRRGLLVGAALSRSSLRGNTTLAWRCEGQDLESPRASDASHACTHAASISDMNSAPIPQPSRWLACFGLSPASRTCARGRPAS